MFLRILLFFSVLSLNFICLNSFAQEQSDYSSRASSSDSYQWGHSHYVAHSKDPKNSANAPEFDVTVGAKGGVTETGRLGAGGKVSIVSRRKDPKNRDSNNNPTYMNKANEKFYITLEMHGGDPVLRFAGESEVFPIDLYVYKIQDQKSNDANGILQVQIVPITVEGLATVHRLNEFRNEKMWGKSQVVVSSDLVTSLIKDQKISGTVKLQIKMSMRAGVAGGYASEDDASSPIVGPKVGALVSSTFTFSGQHSIELKLRAEYVANMTDTAGDYSKVDGELNYAYQFPNSKNQFFVGATTEVTHLDLHNQTPVETPSKEGTTFFVGGQTGFRFNGL